MKHPFSSIGRLMMYCTSALTFSVTCVLSGSAQIPAVLPSNVQHLKPGEWIVVEKDETGQVLRTMRSPIILVPTGDSPHGLALYLSDTVSEALEPTLGLRDGFASQYGTAMAYFRINFSDLEIYTELSPFIGNEDYKAGTNVISRIDIRDKSRTDSKSQFSRTVRRVGQGFDYSGVMKWFELATGLQISIGNYDEDATIWKSLQANPGAYFPKLTQTETASFATFLSKNFDPKANASVIAHYACPQCGYKCDHSAVSILHCPNDKSLMVRYFSTGGSTDSKVAKTPDRNSAQPGLEADNARLQKYKDSVADDIVHWIQVNPVSLPLNSHAEVKYSVNLVGSPTRVGTVFVYQDSNADGTIATVTPDEVNYKAGQNMVYGKLSIESHKTGTVTIHARVNNVSGKPSEQTVQLKIE